METEKLRIYDEHRVAQDIASRQTIHEQGYWYETFHCWVISREDEKDMIYLQLRSEDKKDFPGLFDITAAGHLLADETVKDGVREVREELGLKVSFNELISLGTIKDQLAIGGFLDNEHCHCFLYHKKTTMTKRSSYKRKKYPVWQK
ncbi:NUDIX hydrolase [Planococcus halocryophilus]|uniref:NUDIX hydrolase n=1 Tax=Planococcus halocryophilus TaxID=1215089 RepID=UPI000345A4C1|nr:NUDIX domain-containing protein [Planococcus halocryophilus]